MNFHQGDRVMHWMYGIGQIVNLEKRVLSGSKLLYYEVHVQDLNVWVPADSKVTSRLRSPIPKLRFKRILTILSEPGDPLPEDRWQCKTHLQERMKDCSVESLCQVIRDLFAHRKVQPLETLLGEWQFVLSVTRAQAILELHRLLRSRPMKVEEYYNFCISQTSQI